MSNHVIHVISCHSCHHSWHSWHLWRHSCNYLYSLVLKGTIEGRFNKVGWGGWVGQKMLSRPSADSFAVGKRQKDIAFAVSAK
jgi:hypothetical protein